MSAPYFTCNSCEIQFKSSDLQRYHMKTEWHRYNLKRRIANLPSITAAQFAEKLQISERQRKENEVDEFGFAVLKPRNQSQPKRNHKQKHHSDDARGRGESSIGSKNFPVTSVPIRSLSPAESVASQISKLSTYSEDTITDFGEDTVSEYGFTSESNYDSDSSGSSDVSDSDSAVNIRNLDVNDCIYCKAKYKDIERNVTHMFRAHGLYIPERSYLSDLPGLLKYLMEVIIVGKKCFCCTFQGASLESIRAHMHSKRHCKLPYETKEERERLSRFYDFSTLTEEVKPSGGHVKSDKKIHFAPSADEEADDNQECEINSNYTTVSVDTTGMELTLPTGARVGHRVGQRYYRQNLPLPLETGESRRTVTAADRRIISGVTEKQFKQGLKKMQALEKNAISREIRREKSKRVNFQAHYRDELLQ